MKKYLSEDETFWFKNPKVLIMHLTEVYPKNTYSDIQNLNAIVRLFIIIGLVVFMYTSQLSHLVFSVIVGLVLTYYLYTNVEGFSVPLGHKVDLQGNVCQLPTANNPFGNMIPGDSTTRMPACKAYENDDIEVKTMTDKYFKMGLYRDVNDVWDKNNSQREFVTQPSTKMPDDRDKWAQWCFNSPSCRDGDTDYCLQYNSILYP
jgi:hypothetical protein